MRFLAVLELFKQGLVDLDQADAFGDIEIAGWARRASTATTLQPRPGAVASGAIDDYDG